MSEVFFVFSDESGNYKQKPGKKFIKRNPYYIRSAYVINALDWRTLRDSLLSLKEEFDLDLYDEIKWSETWVGFKQGKISEEEFKLRIEFFKESMSLLNETSYCAVIFTITYNEVVNLNREKDIKKWHIQNIMQRVQYEIQTNADNLAMIFLDPPSSEKERQMFLEIYREIFLNDRFVENYKNLKDTLNFEISHHSVGIQIADYLAGCFNGFLRGFTNSTRIFKEVVYPLIRKNEGGDPLGWGIMGIPSKDETIKEEIRNRLEEIGITISKGSEYEIDF